MARELVISIYLALFKAVFNLFKFFPLKNKVTFVMSFGDNSLFVYEELIKQKYSGDIVFLKSKGSRIDIPVGRGIKQHYFETYHFIDTFLSIYHLATSKFIFLDNYYGFLSAIKFKDEVKCIQLWHAAGAIKQFGIYDPSNNSRSEKAIVRFYKVYSQFHKIVVGSENMAKIFSEAFNANKNKILRTGIPRTDLFFDQNRTEKIKENMLRSFPMLKNKRKILYAPTYREAELKLFSLELDLQKLYDKFSDDTVLLLRLHPAIGELKKFDADFSDFVIDCSAYPNINDLLFVSDYLITDYSSIPFEYALLEKPMIFYPYDLEAYKSERGFWEDYAEFVPGPVAFSTEEIIEIIEQDLIDYEKIKRFKDEWNQYSNGNSSEKLIRALSIK
ncbi:glycerophosphotransferase TagB [Bacillus sp. ZZV12-4809]|nr:glycerophosphotransferase TagB [Bacillus sp. ZZV12-4809]